MDINYILAREQQSLSRASSSTSKSARAVHRSFAAAYGKLLATRGFPHRQGLATEAGSHAATEPLAETIVPAEQ